MKFISNEKAFTLIEMMIVLLIISVLILIAIPNVTKHSKSIDEKGCNAYVKMVQGQIEAYKMDEKHLPSSLTELTEKEYLPENAQCPDGTQLSIDSDGKVDKAGGSASLGATVEKTKESGFTFLEMILVLAVLSIMTAIILPIGDKWIQTESEDDALQVFMATVYNLQAYSMANYVATGLEFKDSGTEYITSYLLKGEGRIEIARNVLPKGMRLSATSQLKAIEFHGNGDILKSGTMAFLTSSGLIEIRFQFQRGRMIIYE